MKKVCWLTLEEAITNNETVKDILHDPELLILKKGVFMANIHAIDQRYGSIMRTIWAKMEMAHEVFSTRQ